MLYRLKRNFVEYSHEQNTPIIRHYLQLRVLYMHGLWNLTKNMYRSYTPEQTGGWGLRPGLWGCRPCRQENRPFLGSSIRPNLVLIRPWVPAIFWCYLSNFQPSLMVFPSCQRLCLEFTVYVMSFTLLIFCHVSKRSVIWKSHSRPCHVTWSIFAYL